MPSKGRKPSRPSAVAAASDRSPLPRTPYSPARELAAVSGAGDDEALHRRLLSEAAARFPALISDAAFYGRVSEVEASPSKGNQARVWLSEAAMVSSSLAPGSFASVSLAASVKEPLNGFPLDNLVEQCGRHFGYDIGNHVANEAGNYFAIATVFPSRKVLKNGVRLSWGLSCTMGFPPTGKATFVCPIGSLTTSPDQNMNDGIAHVKLCKCKDLYLNLVPQTAGPITCVKGLSTSDSLAESGGEPIRNGKVTSPKTPSYQSRLSSPAAIPLHSTKSHDFISSADFSPSLDVSAVRLALEDEKVTELLQIYAARWLYGRHLLLGNLVTVPVCGQVCVFSVSGMEKLPMGCSDQDLTSGEYVPLPRDIQISNSLDQVNAAFLVDTRTIVHLSDSMLLEEQTPNEEGLHAKDVTCKATANKEAGDVPQLGGLSKEFAILKRTILCTFSEKDNIHSLRKKMLDLHLLLKKHQIPIWLTIRYKGVLLHGPPGTGKTSLACLCAHDAGASLFSINGLEIITQHYGQSEQALREIFDSARQAAPAVVFIDELDAIAPARKEGGEGLSRRMVATLSNLMDEINKDDRILVIAATNQPDSIDPSLRRSGRLDREIEIGVPSPEQRLDILGTLLSEIDHSLSSSEVQSLALATHGYVGADLAALCNEAALTTVRHHIKLKSSGSYLKASVLSPDGHAADMQVSDVHKVEDGSYLAEVDSLSSSLAELTVSKDVASEVQEEMLLKVTAEDFEKAKMRVRPSAMREVVLELPKVRWEDVGGQIEVKQQLIEAVQWPQLCPDAFERIGIRPPRGLLMIGPPGCSKTLMARAVASESKVNFLAVKGPELFSKWVGESEKAVRSLFAKARANSPAIIFFDEIDGLAVTRGQENDGTSVADRVLTQLLGEMDGLEQSTGVTVIAATNRPDKIDQALLRPGRFDRLLDVQPPDETDREDIFRIHMCNMPCSSDVSTKALAQLTEGFTGADIKLACREAAIAALEESLEASEVSMAHFKIGISQVQPSDFKFYKDLAAEFRRLVHSGSVRDG